MFPALLRWSLTNIKTLETHYSRITESTKGFTEFWPKLLESSTMHILLPLI
jgi:hypothetical protein